MDMLYEGVRSSRRLWAGVKEERDPWLAARVEYLDET